MPPKVPPCSEVTWSLLSLEHWKVYRAVCKPFVFTTCVKLQGALNRIWGALFGCALATWQLLICHLLWKGIAKFWPHAWNCSRWPEKISVLKSQSVLLWWNWACHVYIRTLASYFVPQRSFSFPQREWEEENAALEFRHLTLAVPVFLGLVMWR